MRFFIYDVAIFVAIPQVNKLRYHNLCCDRKRRYVKKSRNAFLFITSFRSIAFAYACIKKEKLVADSILYLDFYHIISTKFGAYVTLLDWL